MRTDTLETFLQSLAARIPAPGGGASAALIAAQGAALVEMVARYSDTEKYAEHAALINDVRDAAEEYRGVALALAELDAAVFDDVALAYKMPRSTDEEKAERSRAIAAALIEAGRIPACVVAVADQILTLAEQLAPVGNRNVISDVAAAADALGAAASTARVNVEINLSGITDPGARAELSDAIAEVDDLIARADKVTATIREQILR